MKILVGDTICNKCRTKSTVVSLIKFVSPNNNCYSYNFCDCESVFIYFSKDEEIVKIVFCNYMDSDSGSCNYRNLYLTYDIFESKYNFGIEEDYNNTLKNTSITNSNMDFTNLTFQDLLKIGEKEMERVSGLLLFQ